MNVFPRFVLLLLTFLFAGCFTQSYLSKDELPPDDRTVVFRLRDGTTLTSSPRKHRRIDDGYEVIGLKSRENVPGSNFEGIIQDDELFGITMETYNATGTAALITAAGVTLFLILNRWGQGGP